MQNQNDEKQNLWELYWSAGHMTLPTGETIIHPGLAAKKTGHSLYTVYHALMQLEKDGKAELRLLVVCPYCRQEHDQDRCALMLVKSAFDHIKCPYCGCDIPRETILQSIVVFLPI